MVDSMDNENNKDRCKLCLNETRLRKSHIVPSFVGKWLKDSSLTGYLRYIKNPNKRVQDIFKQKLLCSECEGLLSKDEKLFSEKIFYPYVKRELDEWGVAKGRVKKIKYGEWLLRFAVGLQWKALVTSRNFDSFAVDNRVKAKFIQATKEVGEEWRKYLLGELDDSGESRHYIIFLQNLAAGVGYLPEKISDHVNSYLLRSVDMSLAYSKKNILLFSKMGPIALVSGIKPTIFKGMNDALIRKRAELKIAQVLRNSLVNEFIFITRPNEAISRYRLSRKQKEKVTSDTKNKIKNSDSLHSIYVAYSDFLLKKRKEQ